MPLFSRCASVLGWSDQEPEFVFRSLSISATVIDINARPVFRGLISAVLLLPSLFFWTHLEKGT